MDTVSIGRNKQNSVSMRFSLERGGVFRLPQVNRLCVEQGSVWLTQNGQDIVLNTGDVITSELLSPDALLSVAGATCAVLEVLLPEPEAAMAVLGNLFAQTQTK